jgi:hypothetical protein
MSGKRPSKIKPKLGGLKPAAGAKPGATKPVIDFGILDK